MRYLLSVIILVFSGVVVAQDEPPAPQLLYRDGDQLLLLDAYTGETETLLDGVAETDSFEWSPAGRYLVSRMGEDRCANLYDVDTREWVYEEPLTCGSEPILLNDSDERIVYVHDDGQNGILWLQTIGEQNPLELYRTVEGNDVNTEGIRDVRWSPSQRYLLFEPYRWVLGGTLNGFVVLDIETGDFFTSDAPDTYYASYQPIWSPDEKWFLITLSDEYVISGGVPFTNHMGDVYLVNVETGERTRITYTPAERERNLGWTETGEVVFETVTITEYILDIDSVLQVPIVPYEDIVQPGDFEPEINRDRTPDRLISPDPSIRARIVTASNETDVIIRTLEIVNRGQSDSDYAVTLSNSGEVIGWRPSDYPYPQG